MEHECPSSLLTKKGSPAVTTLSTLSTLITVGNRGGTYRQGREDEDEYKLSLDVSSTPRYRIYT